MGVTGKDPISIASITMNTTFLCPVLNVELSDNHSGKGSR